MSSAFPIRVISLARTPQRLETFRRDNAGLEGWSVFPAIDGSRAGTAERDGLGDTSLWSPGGVGSGLSHLALWRECAESGQALTICEDDAVLRADFVEAATALLRTAPDFDIVHWGWNSDSVMECDVAPGVTAAVLVAQGRMREAIGAFRADSRQVALVRLRKSLGTPCYTLSPKGASALLAKLPPFRPQRIAWRLIPTPILNVNYEVALTPLNAELSAHAAFPPLAATRNDWTTSTIRLPDPLAPAAALARADALQAAGRQAEALAVIQSATIGSPDCAELWTRLGLMLAEVGLLNASAAAFEAAIPPAADPSVSLYNLARVRLLQNRPKAALELLNRALGAAPDFALAHSNRGVALLALDRPAEAAAAFAAAASLQPALLEAQRGLAAARAALGDTEGAFQAQAAAARLAPDDAQLADGLAALQLRLAEEARARGELEAAARLAGLAANAPARRLEGLVLLSAILEQQGRFSQSWAAAREAVEHDPRSVPALNNLGVAALRLNRAETAEEIYRAAVALAPDDAEARHGLAYALLKLGRWGEAWPHFDQRLRTPAFEPWAHSFAAPLWDGSASAQATLLLAAEQGFGDMIQAASLIGEVRARVGRIVLQAPAPLLRLLARAPGVDEVVADGAPRPPHDLWLPLMSLPGRLGVQPHRRPPRRPPLAWDPELAAAWRHRLPPADIRIGLAWQGNPASRVEAGRSAPLAAFQALGERPGVALVSLQKGAGVEQIAARPKALAGLATLGAAYDAGDFGDTAAVIAALDLVICVDTAVAHLAAALGRRTWIALGENADWRWPTGRDDSPWYAATRLFRRGAGEGWEAVIARMAADLDALRATGWPRATSSGEA